MAFNVSDALKDIFTSDRVRAAAASLGESESNISKAISGIVPAVIGGVISSTDSGIDGASSILNMAKGASGTGMLANLSNRFGDLQNSDFVTNGLDTAKRLLGDKFETVATAVSRYSGIRVSSAFSLLAVTAPAALGILGKYAADSKLTPASLSTLLSAQRSAVAASLPIGLSSLAGWIKGPAVSVKSAVPPTFERVRHMSPPLPTLEPRKTVPEPRRRFWPILVAILILLALVLLVKDCNKGRANAALQIQTHFSPFKSNLMFDQILQAVKEHFSDNPQLANLTPEQQDAVHQEIATHLNEHIQAQAATPQSPSSQTTPEKSSGLAGMAGGLLSSIEKSVASGGMATSAVTGGLVGALSSKLGLPSAVSGAIAAAVPGLLQKMAQKQEAPHEA